MTERKITTTTQPPICLSRGEFILSLLGAGAVGTLIPTVVSVAVKAAETISEQREEALFQDEKRRIAGQSWPLNVANILQRTTSKSLTASELAIASNAPEIAGLYPAVSPSDIFVVGYASLADASVRGSQSSGFALAKIEEALREKGVDPNSYPDQEVIQSRLLLVQEGKIGGSKNTKLIIIPDSRLPLNDMYVVEGLALREALVITEQKKSAPNQPLGKEFINNLESVGFSKISIR